MSAAVATTSLPAPVPGVAAEFCGWQEWPGRAPIELWNLTEEAGGVPAGSTVDRVQLEELARKNRKASK